MPRRLPVRPQVIIGNIFVVLVSWVIGVIYYADVPLIFGGQYRDNWDLAAARASSVVQELSKANTIPSEKLKAISFGETKPLEQNDTRQGREKNRRIEIEIKY